MLAQTCGLPFAELATELATLPQVISNGALGFRGIFYRLLTTEHDPKRPKTHGVQARCPPFCS